MGSELAGGPFVVLSPQGWVNPAHEHQAVGIGVARDHRRDTVQVHTHGHGLLRIIPCSRAEWMTFVGAVKAGRFDLPVPDDTGRARPAGPGRLEQIDELSDFLAERTRLATADPSIAHMIAERLYDAGWRRVAGDE